MARKGNGHLDEHAKGQKHRDRVPCERQLLITSNASKIDVDLESSSATNQETTATNPVNTLDKPTSPQSSINSFVINGAVTDAELRWSLAVVLMKYCLSSCSGIKKFFQEMFKDSKIAEKFTCGSTKCSYIINFGIAPYFRSLLQDALNNAPYYVCSFDECFNDVIKKGQMDMHTRFRDNSTNVVSTRLY